VEGCNRRKVVCALASAAGIAGLATLFAVSSGPHQHQKHRYNSRVTFAYNFSESDILFVIQILFLDKMILIPKFLMKFLQMFMLRSYLHLKINLKNDRAIK
jgi:hypothetical protein